MDATTTTHPPTTAPMLAAIVDEPGALPRAGTVPQPTRGPGQTLIEVRAAALNPLDLMIASGKVPMLTYDEPYVPGIECVGTVIESDTFATGTSVYAEAHPSPNSPGAFATHLVAADRSVIPLPDGVDPEKAVAVGNAGVAAYVPLVDIAGLEPGDTVLILGATGAVGQLATQIARGKGAGRIVAVGRDEATLSALRDRGADETVAIAEDDDPVSLAEKLRHAVGPDGANVVLDTVFGAPFEAALAVCAPNAHVVNVGHFAGAIVPLNAAVLRGRQLTISGFAAFLTSLSEKAAALEWLWGGLDSGEVTVDVVTHSIDGIATAWANQALSPHAKNVVTFESSSGPQ